MKRLIPITLFILITGCLSAQFYVTGEPPASVKWQQIKAGSFKVIFPEGTEPEAEKFADLLIFYKDSSKIVPGKDVTIPILMRSSSVVSNGYVTWAPKRMDIVSVAPRNSYPQAWLNQLALHEYRHVAQISALRSGFTRFLSVFTGEIATGITSSMIPQWLYEGDAVYNETRLSASGRGRLPEFSMPLRTILLSESRNLSYDKALFGSYRDYVPNHYVIGYHIVNYGNERYGMNLWPDALEYTGRNPYMVTPMAFYLLRNTGRARQHLYREAMDSLRSTYLSRMPVQDLMGYTYITDSSGKDYENYRHPVFSEEGEIIAFKSGLDGNDMIVLLKEDGNETILHFPGTSEMESLSSEGNYVVWDENVRDVRWGGRSYSEIMVFDRTRNKAYPLLRKTRLFSPDISADGKKVAAVETDEKNRCFLSVIDLESGKYVYSAPSPDNCHLQTPEWTAENTIIAIGVKDATKQILEFNPASGNWNLIMESSINISEPVGYEDYVIFRSVSGDVDDLFAVNKQTGRIKRITGSRYGVFSPEVSRDSVRLVFTAYSPKGFDIVTIPLDSSTWLSSTPEIKNNMSATEGTSGLVGLPVPRHDYLSKPYSRFNMIKFHSWLPFFTDINVRSLSGLKILPGFMLFSQNITGTSFGYLNYYAENNTHIINPEFTFTGFYPVIRFSGDFKINGPAMKPENEGLHETKGNSFMVESYVPLLFTKGRRILQIIPGAAYRRLDIAFNQNGIEMSGLDLLRYSFNVSLYRRRSYRDILPRLGLTADISGYLTPFNRPSFGNLISVSGNLYLPGIFKHHNLYLRQGFQKQRPEKYLLPFSPVYRPRGINYGLSEWHYSLSLNYTLPVFYPDWSVPSVLYIRRLWLNGYVDFAYGKNVAGLNGDFGTRVTGSFYSYGSEIYADINPLRFIFPVTAGIRIGYVPERNGFFTEFIMTVDTGI